MSDVAFRPAVDLARMLRSKEIGSLELTEHYIARIERLDREINAVVVRDFERARAAARAADARLAAGETAGPLHGVPMTIKDSYDVRGLPTTWGIPLFKDNVASRDAEVVARLKRAGAVFLGKTNVPFSLGDFQSYNEIYGVTRNPWDLGRTPGGSSGGSAAALAAGLTGLECGSDIGGSIRNPAHYCGVYGHKPTWGIVPPQGHALPGNGRGTGHRRLRAAGAQRRGSGARDGHPGRPRATRRSRVGAPPAGAEDIPPGLPHRALAHGHVCPGRHRSCRPRRAPRRHAGTPGSHGVRHGAPGSRCRAVVCDLSDPPERDRRRRARRRGPRPPASRGRRRRSGRPLARNRDHTRLRAQPPRLAHPQQCPRTAALRLACLLRRVGRLALSAIRHR